MYRLEGYRIEVRTKEAGHNRPHAHVVGADGEASIALDNLEVLASRGFSEKTLAKIVAFVAERRTKLQEKWNEYHE